jgi:salicylate hydroxylase
MRQHSHVFQLTLDQANPQGFSEWEHKTTKTYANGRLCIIGDAAHATTPWQGSGAGMAIEDAMIMRELLGHIQYSADFEACFAAFDAIRRPRCQRIIDSSRQTGRILTGQATELQLDPSKLGQGLSKQWDFIVGLDMEQHKKDALEKLRDLQQR